MIQKLRVKFIFINMIFVVSILSVVLGLLFFFSSKKFERETEGVMLQALNPHRPERREAKQTDPEKRVPLTPIFLTPTIVISLDSDDVTVTDIQENNISVSEDMAKELVAKVNQSGGDKGRLSGYSLRYIKTDTPDGIRIVFADQSYELNSLRNLLISCLVLLCLASLLFFLLSLYLSKWALRPAEKAWQQQNQFIADASHELKTPLTVILANLQILSSHKDATIESQSKWLDNTKEETGRMRRLVEELLFLARHDAGIRSAATAIPASFDFSNTVLTCVLLFESVAFENKVMLNQDIEPDIFILGDENQYKQVISILLDNACKYAGRQGITSVSLKKSQNHVTLTVHNTGDPIAAEEQSHIFERFYRTDKSRARKEGGYGLGLAIASTILEEQGGKISVTSSTEEGTAFKVRIPVS